MTRPSTTPGGSPSSIRAPCARPLYVTLSLCEYRTVNTSGTPEPLDFGQRIAQARDEADMTQADLAKAVGLDRTAVAKLEVGTRRVSASELVAIAAAVDRPIDWFVSESPPAVLSRRSDAAAGGRSRSLDLKVERLARDVSFLVDQAVLTESAARVTLQLPTDLAGTEALAAQARSMMGSSDGPLYDLQRAVERVGLLAFCLDLGETGGDAAYVEVDNLGVALLNGYADPGRRRFNLAHELGHHLFGDAYASEVAINTGSETELLINAFAVHLLLPRQEVTEEWRTSAGTDPRLAAVALSFKFRASWTATCKQLRTLGLIDDQQRVHFVANRPTAADAIALGERWVAELESPTIPPEYGKRVIAAYEAGKLAAAKTVELLWGTVSIADLPGQRNLPLESLRRDFEPLS